MRQIAPPFVVAPPAGARIRTRLRLDDADAQVLVAVGEHLGRLAGMDLATRVRSGLPVSATAKHKRAVTRDRKRALTAESSSRWAGTIVRVSEDTVERATRNLTDTAAGLRRTIKVIRRRLAVKVGTRQGRVRGYASRQERWAKRQRLQQLQARLEEIERQLDQGQVRVVRGGRGLLNTRQHLEVAGLTEPQWRRRWEAARWFLCADGEAGKRLGNETIRVHPDEGWLELKLPASLAHLANRPHGRYRLGCPVGFSYRTTEWAAQTVNGAVAYEVWFDPDRGRWYLDASWRPAPRQVPRLEDLRRQPTLAVDLNADHLAGWVVAADGKPLGDPITIPLDLAGLSAATRDGRLHGAVSQLLRQATASGCHSVTVENLDFADARQVGRETLGRGRRGKRFRRVISGIPTGALRDSLAGMAANAGIWVIAVDPGWTSVWGRRYWKAQLDNQTRSAVAVSGHHAASVVIGRRGLGHRARRRGGCAPSRPEDRAGRAADSAGRPTIATPDRAVVVVPKPVQGTGGPGGQRAGPVACKTCVSERTTSRDQAAQDRSALPEAAGYHPSPS